MVVVKVRVEAAPTTDYYLRYHGLAVDQGLDECFWDTQPDKIIQVTGDPFAYERDFDLAPGEHTVEYGNSGYVPDYAWHAKIYVDGRLVAEGDAGRNQHLKATFRVEIPPPTPPTPTPKPELKPWLAVAGPVVLGSVMSAVGEKRGRWA
jgi:hypothetical protein